MERLQQILENKDWKSLEKFVDKMVATENGRNVQSKEGRLYYENQNAIARKSNLDQIMGKAKRDSSPLRNADYRISHNWHQLLVNQKVAYLFSTPPIFESGSSELNKSINGILGESFSRTVKNLAIDAANCGVAWLHLWLDATGNIVYNTVPMEEIYPIYNDDLYAQMQYLIRIYQSEDEKGNILDYVEIWDKETSSFFVKQKKGSLAPDLRFGEKSNLFHHGLGDIPFIPFYNNRNKSGDLAMVKDLIDQYDLVMSGFANDLADIQEVIFVLRNYGGEDLNTFLSELKRYKAIKVEGESISSGGVETMKIEIPVEARVKFLEILRNQIFVSGQGVNPDPQQFGNSSGVALKYLYSLLEIKAGLLEGEFRAGFKRLLQMILRYIGVDEGLEITQIYSRNSIENDMEKAEIAQKSSSLLSRETLLKNHPWVEDTEKEKMFLQNSDEEK